MLPAFIPLAARLWCFGEAELGRGAGGETVHVNANVPRLRNCGSWSQFPTFHTASRDGCDRRLIELGHRVKSTGIFT